MIESLLIGSGFAIAAALQPGPLQAFLFSSVSRRGWRKTLPAAFAPVISDGPIAVMVVFILNRMPEQANALLQAAGGLLLLYFAWSSFTQWRSREEPSGGEPGPVPRTIFQAAMVNLLNPNPYLGWSLVLGPAAISAWSDAPMNAVALIGAFYITIVSATMAVILLFGLTNFLGKKRQRSLILISAVILAVLGVYQLVSGISSFHKL